MVPGVSSRAAARVGRRRQQQHQPGDRPRHRGPQVADQSPADQEGGRRDRHPHRRVADDQRAVLRSSGSTPASTPSSVACRQNPASPALSSPTLSSRDSTKTWPDHSGEVPTAITAATTPTQNGHPHRVDPRARRRPESPCSLLGLPDLAGGLLKQAVGGAGEQPERAPEHGEHGESRRFEVPRGEVEHRVAAQRADSTVAAPTRAKLPLVTGP